MKKFDRLPSKHRKIDYCCSGLSIKDAAFFGLHWQISRWLSIGKSGKMFRALPLPPSLGGKKPELAVVTSLYEM